MGMLRKIFSFLLAVILIPVLFATMLAVNMDRALLNPEFYKSALRNGDAYKKIIEEGPKVAFSVFLKSQGLAPGATLGPFSQDDFVKLVKNSIPKQWLEENVNTIIDQALGYLLGERSDIRLAVSFVDIKANFSYYIGKDVLGKINTIPYCTTDQLRKLQSSGNMMGIISMNCRPAGVDAQAIRRFMGGNNDPFAMIPSKVDLGELFKQKEQYFNQARDYVGIFKKVEMGLAVVSLLFVGIIVVINRQHKKAMGIWIGVPMILVSFIMVGIGIFLRVISGARFEEKINLPESAKKMLIDVIGTFANQLAQNLFITAGIAAIIGIGFMIIMAMMGKEYPTLDKKEINSDKIGA